MHAASFDASRRPGSFGRGGAAKSAGRVRRLADFPSTLRAPLLLATLLPSIASAADSTRYDACLAAFYQSRDMRDAEIAGGKSTVNEAAIDRCGHRATRTSANHRPALVQKDCRMLFRWAQQHDCRPADFASYQSDALKQLDPAAVDMASYARECVAMSDGARSIGYADFQRRVCAAPAAAVSKRPAAGASAAAR